MDKLSSFLCNIYALALFAGGIIGFIKAHSKYSLIMGIASSILIFLALKVGSNNYKAGYLFASSISLILATFFSVRFAATHSFMPAGLMLILSTLTYVSVARGWLKNKN